VPEHAEDCRAAAQWLADDLASAGLENAAVLETGGHPIVYADWLHAANAPTVLVYGHYDVQPPDPLDEWNTAPFEPTIVDGAVVARGSADDKGQLLIHVRALEAMLADGPLPVNVKFLLEGEEESGSEHLDAFIESNAERLAADVCLISDTHMLSAEQPSLVASLRGMTYCEVHVTGPSHDLHSGAYGGGVRNPAEALARIIAQLKDDDGRIAIPGFYDDVRELTEADRAELARVPFSEDAFREESGVSETFGEAGFTVYEQVGARPTLEVNGLVSGYTGEGAKTVLPARAMAKISMRLVADQDWRTIGELFTRYVESLAPSGTSVIVKTLHGGDPSLVERDAPAVRAASRALEMVFGKAPVFLREGGSIPVVASFERLLGVPTVLMGFGLPDDRLHSPNEKFSLDQFHKGITTSIHFWHELAAEWADG
jgi:acetylornithine deacetylase/succinyl-diaminopimelate desuccinylase-like protein